MISFSVLKKWFNYAVKSTSVIAGVLVLATPFSVRAAAGDFSWATPIKLVSAANGWSAMAASSDGKTVVVTDKSGYINVSHDAGTTWQTVTLGSQYWVAPATNANGTKLAAVVQGGYIYTSSDSGVSWQQQTNSGVHTWDAIASSADGTKLAAIADGGLIYTSSDSGITWTQHTLTGETQMASITSSADGTKLAISTGSIASPRYIYTSTDSGVTWTQQSGAGQRAWSKITSSADGTHLAAAVRNSTIYTSADGGVTWSHAASADSRLWYSVDMSADGANLVASESGGYIYTSRDSGATWIKQTSGGSRYWDGIVIADDGNKIISFDSSKNVYVGTQTMPSLLLNDQALTDNTMSLDKDGAAHVTLSGLGYANGTVNVTVHSDPITCSTVSDASGNWSCTLPAAIPGGTHTVSVLLTNPATGATWTLGPYTIQVAGGNDSDPTTITNNDSPTPSVSTPVPAAPDTGFAIVSTKVWLIGVAVCGGALGLLKVAHSRRRAR